MVATRNGGIATCDIPVSDNLEQFDRDYRTLTGQVRESGESYELGEDYMVIGTSALAGYEIDGAVSIYAGCYNNPFLIWGKYRKKWLRATLPVSFQFHHTQLDGIPAAEFLERLQRGSRSSLNISPDAVISSAEKPLAGFNGGQKEIERQEQRNRPEL